MGTQIGKSTGVLVLLFTALSKNPRATATFLAYNQTYDTRCPKPFLELSISNIPQVAERFEHALSFLELHEKIHTVSIILCIIVIVVQLLCTYKTYLDYGYVMFRNEGASIEKRGKVF